MLVLCLTNKPRMRYYITILLLISLLSISLISSTKSIHNYDEDDYNQETNDRFRRFQENYEKRMRNIESNIDEYRHSTDEFEEYKSNIFDKIVGSGLYSDQIEEYKKNENRWKEFTEEKRISVRAREDEDSDSNNNTENDTENDDDGGYAIFHRNNNNESENSESSTTTSPNPSFLSLTTRTSTKTTQKFPRHDDPKYFFSKDYHKNISNLPKRGIVRKTPWSGSYYPTKYGGISVRYSNDRYNTRGIVNSYGQYTQFYSYFQSIYKYHQPMTDRFMRRLNSRSPYRYYKFIQAAYSASEKYDKLVGDNRFTLTNWTKNEGRQYLKGKNMPSWYGICHGWAPAAYMYKRPYKPVTLLASDGRTRVQFLPDDIKGLASQYMATATYKTRWIGAKCNYYKSNHGWFSDPSCRSINPGAFLIALGNRIGLEGKSIVFDPEADPEIWNQPIKAYSAGYYNILTRRFTGNTRYARSSIEQLKRYCRSRYCWKVIRNVSSETEYVIGVVFRVKYTKETELLHSYRTIPEKMQTDTFDSIVELDKDGNIIGGSWNHIVHPNFIWMPDEEHKMSSVGDGDDDEYSGKPEQLREMRENAVKASRKGQLLKVVVEYLIKRAS